MNVRNCKTECRQIGSEDLKRNANDNDDDVGDFVGYVGTCIVFFSGHLYSILQQEKQRDTIGTFIVQQL